MRSSNGDFRIENGEWRRWHSALPSSQRFLASTRPSRLAFTLVELMVVVVILGVLATVVTVSVNDYLITGKQTAARNEIAQITTALELFYTENDHYPANDKGLDLLQKKTTRHPNGILQGDLLDPWGHAYLYVYPGLHGVFDLLSQGADGQQGGEGADMDIVSWNLAGIGSERGGN